MCKDIWSELRIGGLSAMLNSSLKVVGEQLMDEYDWFSNNDYCSNEYFKFLMDKINKWTISKFPL